RVFVVEPLGRQREVTVDIGENRVAIVTPHEGAAPGDQVTISVAPGRVLLFDGTTGRRIANEDLPLDDRMGGAIQPEVVGYA
ncbi:MAG TPA: TOBE domain-containing protein, partial [Thermomicrobiales bacterium]|nr:TOBE domain-containing protein [Thermomicrobiales bacterium]